MDTGAVLMPRDIAFGWGRMSDTEALENVKISQSGRFAFWRTDVRPSDSDIATINTSSANTHLIPRTTACATPYYETVWVTSSPCPACW